MKIYKISARSFSKEPNGKYRTENTVIELKISLGGLISGVAIRADKIRVLEDRTIEFIKFEQQRENKFGGGGGAIASGTSGQKQQRIQYSYH